MKPFLLTISGHCADHERPRATEKRYRNGTRELYLEDGTIWRIFVDGTEIIDFLNGEREIRTIEYRVSRSDSQTNFGRTCSPELTFT